MIQWDDYVRQYKALPRQQQCEQWQKLTPEQRAYLEAVLARSHETAPKASSDAARATRRARRLMILGSVGVPVVAIIVLAISGSIAQYAHPRQSLQSRQQHDNARVLVVQALDEGNKLGVTGREFQTKVDAKGNGIFVFDPRTTFMGTKRYLIWVVVEGQAYALNGPSKMLTPTLKWPREAEPSVWRRTGLNPYTATEAIETVFGRQ